MAGIKLTYGSLYLQLGMLLTETKSNKDIETNNTCKKKRKKGKIKKCIKITKQFRKHVHKNNSGIFFSFPLISKKVL